jgi:hypothetical protein
MAWARGTADGGVLPLAQTLAWTQLLHHVAHLMHSPYVHRETDRDHVHIHAYTDLLC